MILFGQPTMTTAPQPQPAVPSTMVAFPLFCALWYVVAGYPFPRHQQRLAKFLETAWQDNKKQLLIMAFRAAGKSTLVGLFCAWLLYHNNNWRILVLSAEQSLATKMVRVVKQLIERHPLLKGLKPDRPEQWASDEFTIARDQLLRDPSMVARGLYANITGFRADIIICDDVEVPSNSDSADKRRALRRRLAEIDFVLAQPVITKPTSDHETTQDTNNQHNKGGMQIYIGTPHARDSIYNTTPGGFLSGFYPFILPLLDQQGQSAWPEKFSPAVIEKLRTRQGIRQFARQMMLRQDDEERQLIDSNLIREYDANLSHHESNGISQFFLLGQWLPSGAALKTPIAGIGCFWDPAFGAPDKKGDGSVVAVVMKDSAGHYYIQTVCYLTTPHHINPAQEQIERVLVLVAQYGIQRITVENNGLGQFLPGLLRAEIKKRRWLVAVQEATARGSKAGRIFAVFDSLLAAGALHAHRSLRQTKFYDEMADFRLTSDSSSNRHDDGLDAVAGCLQQPFHRLHGFQPS